MQASLSLTAAVNGSSQSHPSLIVKEMPGEKVEVFQVCEQVTISEISGMEAPLLLLATYSSYNIYAIFKGFELILYPFGGEALWDKAT